MAEYKCRGCGSRVSYGVIARQTARLYDLGVPKAKVKRSLMPRCERCVTRATRDGTLVLPQAQMALGGRAITLMHVPVADWPAALSAIRAAAADYVCVRDGGVLLVATPLPFAGVAARPPLEAAAYVEKAIVARPPGTSPRFVASRAWGGED